MDSRLRGNDGVWGLLLLLGLTNPATAQTIVTSPGPDTSSVTIYREPGRADGGSLNVNWLQGFALITEQRRITIPAGPSIIRFEGVADGMIAVSAVVTGLPGGVVQKNRDAALLSPAALLNGTLGNRVHIRRTNRQTGVVTETEAIIRSGADNAVVLQTAQGVEALQCSGLPETLIYDVVPAGLSATPTLSVTTNSVAEATASVTLTYLATGFDWSADYVARIAPDGTTLNLFGWLTVGNSNSVSFADAQMLAIAGTVNRVSDYDALVEDAPEPELNLQCWPAGTTSDLSQLPPEMAYLPPPSPPPPPMMTMGARMEAASDIMVTASRMATREELGDLKLYRVPMRVDVNASGLKQVALLQQPSVPFTVVYEGTISGISGSFTSMPLSRTIRMKNEKKVGLGLPLPSGGIAVFEQAGGSDQLLARDTLRDHAEGEKVEIDGGQAANVRYTLAHDGADKADTFDRIVTVTNAAPRPAPVEVTLMENDNEQITRPSAKLGRKDGQPVWNVTVAPNGTAILRYRVTKRR